MHILLDECVNLRLRLVFLAHQVTTVADADWRGISDSQLLRLANGKFDVFITLDQGFAHQHNLRILSFGIVILHVRKNSLRYYEPILIGFAKRAKKPIRAKLYMYTRRNCPECGFAKTTFAQ